VHHSLGTCSGGDGGERTHSVSVIYKGDHLTDFPPLRALHRMVANKAIQGCNSRVIILLKRDRLT
jgi:hypothetical protein